MRTDARSAHAGLSWLAAPLAIGIAWRFLGLLHPATIDTDGAYYGAVARWFADGHWAKALDPVWPPLLPFLASFGVRAGVAVETAGIVVSFLASVACIATIGLLTRRVAGGEAGRWAAWLAAVHPKLVSYGLQFLTESLYAACTCTVLLVCARARGDARSAIAAGVLLAAACLTRPEAAGFLPALLVWLTWRGARAAEGAAVRRGRGVALAALALAAFAAGVAPYAWQVSRVQGRLSLGEKGALNFYLTYRDAYTRAGIAVAASDFAAITAPGVAREPGHYAVADFARHEPWTVISHTLANLPAALAAKIPALLGWPLWLLAVAGACWPRRRLPRHPVEWLFVVWVVTVALSISPFFLYRRFFIATLPPLLVWAAIGVTELVLRFGRRARAGAAAGIALLALAAQWSVWHQRWPHAYRDAGNWIAVHAPSPAVIAARKPETAFYAAAEFRPLPVLASMDSLLPFLRQAGATHFVADDYILPHSHPVLAPLVDPGNAPPWLQPMHTARDGAHRVVVYAFAAR